MFAKSLNGIKGPLNNCLLHFTACFRYSLTDLRLIGFFKERSLLFFFDFDLDFEFAALVLSFYRSLCRFNPKASF